MTYLLNFEKLGRNDNVEIEVEELNEKCLNKKIQHYLLSSNWEWFANLETMKGVVMVGFRCCFEFTIKEQKMAIWHSKDEQPKTNLDIFMVCENEGVVYTKVDSLEENQRFGFDYLLNWCYVSDLLAQDKRFEEPQQKLDDAKRTLTSALQWLACPDDISELTGKCNVQNAFDEIRECLERIK